MLFPNPCLLCMLPEMVSLRALLLIVPSFGRSELTVAGATVEMWNGIEMDPPVKSICYHVWHVKLDLWGPHTKRRELISSGCPLTFTCVL